MKTRFSHLAMTLAIFLIVTGCKQQAAPDAAAQPVATEPAAEATKPVVNGPTWDESQAPVNGVELTVSPNPADFCNDPMQAVNVKWDATDASISSLQIWVQDPAGNRKVWAVPTTRSGEKQTGKWIRPDSRIIVVDTSRAVVLNSATVTAAPCG